MNGPHKPKWPFEEAITSEISRETRLSHVGGISLTLLKAIIDLGLEGKVAYFV